MKLTVLALLLSSLIGFDDWFTGSTLRLDYIFAGDSGSQNIYFMEAARTGEWAGRRSNLDETLLRGNGEIRLLDPDSGATLYVNSFSTLFQEWVSYEEATQVKKGFENCFQVPFPKVPVLVQITLWDSYGRESATLTHRIDPSDILIRQVRDTGLENRIVFYGNRPEKAIDILIVSDAYTEAERDKFFADAARSRDALLGHEPFKSNASRFNIRAVFAPSADSGPSIPHENLWNRTALGSHFDTFYSERYLTTSRMRQVWDAAGTLPFEQIIVLVNTPVYGGGGIYNNVTVMGSDHPTFRSVIVHEFGHAFGALADEYFYDDMYESPYPLSVEPWEPNITTKVDFASKWEDMMGQDGVGLYEGGGYTSHGVFRPVPECRMKINECDSFCPVCTRALIRMMDYLTE